MHGADECDGGDDIVRGGDHRGEPEAPLEPHRQIDQRDDEAEQDGGERFALELPAHLGTYRLALHDLVLPCPDAPVERASNGVGHRLGTRLTLRRVRAESRAHHVRRVGAEILNVGAA